MEEKINILRAKFSALNKEKDERLKKKNEREARVAELSEIERVGGGGRSVVGFGVDLGAWGELEGRLG